MLLPCVIEYLLADAIRGWHPFSTVFFFFLILAYHSKHHGQHHPVIVNTHTHTEDCFRVYLVGSLVGWIDNLLFGWLISEIGSFYVAPVSLEVTV